MYETRTRRHVSPLLQTPVKMSKLGKTGEDKHDDDKP
jgi:hypothetical protein